MLCLGLFSSWHSLSRSANPPTSSSRRVLTNHQPSTSVLPSYLENSTILLALQSKSRRHINSGRRPRRTSKRLGHVHRGVHIPVDGSSRPGRHHRLHDFGTGHSLRRDGDRDVNRAGDHITLDDWRRGDGDSAGVGARCEDHVGALVGSSLADAGFAGGRCRCADEHAAVEGHRLVCWRGKAADAIRDATGWCYGSCRGEVDGRGAVDEFGDGLVVGQSLGARRLGRQTGHWRRRESLAVGDRGGLLDVIRCWGMLSVRDLAQFFPRRPDLQFTVTVGVIVMVAVE